MKEAMYCAACEALTVFEGDDGSEACNVCGSSPSAQADTLRENLVELRKLCDQGEDTVDAVEVHRLAVDMREAYEHVMFEFDNLFDVAMRRVDGDDAKAITQRANNILRGS